jgi:hypothetical protein
MVFYHEQSDDEVVSGVVLAFVGFNQVPELVQEEVVLHQFMIGFAIILIPYVLFIYILVL